MEAIVNISKRQLTTSKKLVLNQGLNFATNIKRIPYLHLIAPIEDAALNIPKARADKRRYKVRQAFDKASETKHLKNEDTGHQIATVS